MINVVLTLVIVGVMLYLVETYVPLSPPIRTLIRIVVILFLCIWLLRVFGLLGRLDTIPLMLVLP